MSNSELLRIKNKRKASYKSRKTARSNLKILSRPNDRFGFKSDNNTMIDINAKKENCLARDKEFLSIYNDAFNFMIENRVPDPHNRALHWTIENGQPHYNLSYSRAYRVVCQMITGDRIAFNSHLRQMMWSEICKKVKSLTTLHPDLSIAKALEFVLLHSRASRFFVTPRQAERGIARSRKMRRQALQSIVGKHQS